MNYTQKVYSLTKYVAMYLSKETYSIYIASYVAEFACV